MNSDKLNDELLSNVTGGGKGGHGSGTGGGTGGGGGNGTGGGDGLGWLRNLIRGLLKYARKLLIWRRGCPRGRPLWRVQNKNIENNPMQSSNRPPAGARPAFDTSGKSAAESQHPEIPHDEQRHAMAAARKTLRVACADGSKPAKIRTNPETFRTPRP